MVFHVKRRSLLQGIISRGRAAATPHDRRLRSPRNSSIADSSTGERGSLVHDPESMAGSAHCESEVEESESLRSDANIAGAMTEPVPGPRTAELATGEE